MDVKFCARPGCHEVAIGVGYWQGRGANINPYPRRPDLCRADYLEHVAADLVRCEVTGPARIVDVRTQESVAKPGIVELDPAETNIAILVATQLVKVLPVAPAGKADAKKA